MRKQAPKLIVPPTVARLIAVLALIYTFYYLDWRVRYSFNLDAIWFSMPLWLAEVHGAFNFLLFVFMTWDVKPTPVPPILPGHTVDIFIPTYNEDLSVLRMTILGALNVRYPHETWILDDGRRPELQQLCTEMGVHYLTRPDNRHHKAGNVNAAIAQTNGEFIAIFDADQVPLPDFIDHTIGYFADEKWPSSRRTRSSITWIPSSIKPTGKKARPGTSNRFSTTSFRSERTVGMRPSGVAPTP